MKDSVEPTPVQHQMNPIAIIIPHLSHWELGRREPSNGSFFGTFGFPAELIGREEEDSDSTGLTPPHDVVDLAVKK
jgi:hypothetical protein